MKFIHVTNAFISPQNRYFASEQYKTGVPIEGKLNRLQTEFIFSQYSEI